jgi:nucleoside-diphosphate-sugar epimerase
MQWFRQWNPTQQIHLVHHADVAQAIMLATDTLGVDGQIYNVADDEPVTVGEIMQMYREPIAEDASRRELNAAWHQIVDTRKIHEELGFHPIYPAFRNAVIADALFS